MKPPSGPGGGLGEIGLEAAEDIPDSFLATPAADRLWGASVEPEEPAPGAALPEGERYELGECLGEGGMGQVFKAFDRRLGRPVALKFLTQEDPAMRRLFRREARIQARLEHRHVLPIYDRGEWGGRPFLAMRYVAGGTLAEVDDALSLGQKVRLLIQVAEGLDAVHRAGLLHRDVKPSNVLVARMADGELEALITDFGLAVELGEAARAVDDGVAGSPQYIAPERLSGSPARQRSDVYSLGVTIYRLLVGEVPFAGRNTLEVLRHVVRDELRPPRQRMPSLPVALEAIILRSVAREPERRYASARAVAADLECYLDGEMVGAHAAGLAWGQDENGPPRPALC